MKIDTTSVAVEDWIGQEMIYIYKYGTKENQDNLCPVLFKKKEADCKRQYKMNSVV